jgi:hypothetical protein
MEGERFAHLKVGFFFARFFLFSFASFGNFDFSMDLYDDEYLYHRSTSNHPENIFSSFTCSTSLFLILLPIPFTKGTTMGSKQSQAKESQAKEPQVKMSVQPEQPTEPDKTTLPSPASASPSSPANQRIDITIKPPSAKVLSLTVKPDSTVSSLKVQLRFIAGCAADEQQILFEENELADSSTLEECGIIEKSVLDLLINAATPLDQTSADPLTKMNIVVNPLLGGSWPLKNVTPDDTILDLKEALAYLVGFEPENQRLIFQSKQLFDEKTVGESGITNGSKLDLVFRKPA